MPVGVPIRTEAMRAAILLRVRKGAPFSIASSASGCGRTAFYDWRRDDPTFEAALDEAKNAFLQELVDKAQEIALTDVKYGPGMIQWLLERRAFQSYASRKETLGHTADFDELPAEAAAAAALEPATDSEAALAEVGTLLVAAGVVSHPQDADSEDLEVHPEAALDPHVGVGGRPRKNGSTNGVPASTEP